MTTTNHAKVGESQDVLVKAAAKAGIPKAYIVVGLTIGGALWGVFSAAFHFDERIAAIERRVDGTDRSVNAALEKLDDIVDRLRDGDPGALRATKHYKRARAQEPAAVVDGGPQEQGP